MYLEMSRDDLHGGGSWRFPLCIWAPTDRQGGGNWPFWSKVREVKAGDTILHLRGMSPKAAFVGYSTASSDGFETSDRPPEAGAWAYSSRFFRANLEGFIPFEHPISLTEVFDIRRAALHEYFDRNRARKSARQNIFYVRQSGRLQCLNGAYLSDVDDELFSILFGIGSSANLTSEPPVPVSVVTGQQLATIQARQGQAAFARELKKLYGSACCFPSCSVADSRFLVASHIARWSDNERLRGHLGNGLCLCLMHDRAFEIGLFTLDDDFRVFVNVPAISETPFGIELKSAHGIPIRRSTVALLDEALAEHRARVKLLPSLNGGQEGA